ncbi:HAD-like domain-containing protein [Mariannaea sp. PMI_226]|nr:HAD-like domain-containing protein [Mariannaea sp. PMI_226]
MSRLSDFRLLSFDVYGTLIDWETGVINSLKPLVEANNASFTRKHLLEVYHEVEQKQQIQTPGMKYSELLTTIHPQVAERLGLAAPTDEQNQAFGSSIGSWPAFPDTVEALRRLSKHYKLVVLSNVDLDSFASSNKGPLEGFPFDLIITAQNVGSYKPNLKNFEYMLREVEAKFGVKKSEVLQTAQSQFHDHHPAKKMGIKSSWIERPGSIMGNTDDLIYNWRFETLKDMADALEAELGSS